MRFTSVVLPAPFGPISPNTCCGAIARSTSATACTPPKRLEMRSHSSNIGRPDLLQLSGLAQFGERHQPARQIDDHEHQDEAGEDVAVLLERPQDLGQRGEECRAHDRPRDAGRPADHGEHENLDRAGEAEVAGLYGKIEMRREAPGPRRDGRPGDECRKLVAADGDALARRGDLVLADRGPGAHGGRTLDAPQHVSDDGEREVDLPELGDRRDAIQAKGFPGERQREQDDAHDLAETDRRDGKVHAAEPEDREAEREREHRGEQRPDREAQRERDPEAHPEQGGAVRADGHERGVPERELSRIQGDPDREREQRVDADDADRRLIHAEELRDGVHYARSTERCPRRPRGRITSTRKRRPNASASRSSANSAGRNTRAAISPMPRMYAPRTAPGRLPMPPTTITVNALSSYGVPICG